MPRRLNTRTVNVCPEPGCGVPVEYRATGRTGSYRQWMHEGETRVSVIGPSEEGWRGHSARPTSLCADCGGPVTTWQDAWADYAGCTPCGTYNRFSIGD